MHRSMAALLLAPDISTRRSWLNPCLPDSQKCYLDVFQQFLLAEDGAVVDFAHQAHCEVQGQFLFEAVLGLEVAGQPALVLAAGAFVLLDQAQELVVVAGVVEEVEAALFEGLAQLFQPTRLLGSKTTTCDS